MHTAYLAYWFLHQKLLPEHKMFIEPANVGTLAVVVLLIGFGYAYPGYLAFTNSQPISAPVAVLVVWMFSLGVPKFQHAGILTQSRHATVSITRVSAPLSFIRSA